MLHSLVNRLSGEGEIMSEPLAGFRVVDMTIAVQGPAAGLYLSDMGAEVIKVEPPLGDPSRYGRGHDNNTPEGTLGPQFVACNRGKRSVCVDMETELGQRAVHALLETADVFITNYRESALQKMGLGYDDLHARYERLVDVPNSATSVRTVARTVERLLERRDELGGSRVFAVYERHPTSPYRVAELLAEAGCREAPLRMEVAELNAQLVPRRVHVVMEDRDFEDLVEPPEVEDELRAMIAELVPRMRGRRG